MRIKKNGKVNTITESDLNRMAKRVLKEEETNVDFGDDMSSGIDKKNGPLNVEGLEKRISALEKEVHGIIDGESDGDRPLQEQIDWINSGMGELSNSVSMLQKQISKLNNR